MSTNTVFKTHAGPPTSEIKIMIVNQMEKPKARIEQQLLNYYVELY